MDLRFLKKCGASGEGGQRMPVPHGRLSWVAASLLALTGVMVLSGCSHRGLQGTVPVRGRVTFGGGPWPKPGMISFSPVTQTGETSAALPAFATFDTDGNFVVKCAATDGLLPAEYEVSVICWKISPDSDPKGKGVSHVPKRFANRNTSGLTLSVKPGSGPIVQNWDIPAE